MSGTSPNIKSLIRCGVCGEELQYPPVQVPVGPTIYEPDQLMTQMGLDYQKGVVKRANCCLVCAGNLLARMRKEFLLTGDRQCFYELPSPVPLSIGGVLGNWLTRLYRWFYRRRGVMIGDPNLCPMCKGPFAVDVEWTRDLTCPYCRILLRMK